MRGGREHLSINAGDLASLWGGRRPRAPAIPSSATQHVGHWQLWCPLSRALGWSHTCNFKFYSNHVKQVNRTGDIDFNNIFYFTQMSKPSSFRARIGCKNHQGVSHSGFCTEKAACVLHSQRVAVDSPWAGDRQHGWLRLPRWTEMPWRPVSEKDTGPPPGQDRSASQGWPGS